jgi:imidazolonepropionase
MLIHSATQLLTLKGGPQRGRALGSLGIIENGAVLIRDEKIVVTGPTDELRAAYPGEPGLDASGCVVMPGFVDPHTHLIWGGDRAREFEMRLEGAKYLDILAAGGGIISTVRATRTASIEALIAQTRPRLLRMFATGTTTAEAKTGYGLQTATELRLLKALLALDDESPMDLAITFLGAHAIAPEFKNDPQGYTDLVIETMLPLVQQWWETHAPRLPLPFVDVFCEDNAFTLEQSRRILTKARSLGFPLKIHADEFDNLGGASLAVELGAASADHLVKTADADIAALGASDTVAVSLPCTPFGLAETEYTPAGLQPRHRLERVHAVCHRAGLSLYGHDTRAGDCRFHHQFSPRHQARRPHRFARRRKAGRSAGAVGAGLSSSGISLWHKPSEAGYQAWTGLLSGRGLLSHGVGKCTPFWIMIVLFKHMKPG